MKITPVDMTAAVEKAVKYPYALIFSLSNAYMGKTPETVDMEALVEGHFFDGHSELRILAEYDRPAAYLLEEEDGDVTIDHSVKLIRKFGNRMTVCKYLKEDGDGQRYISAVRLKGWEG